MTKFLAVLIALSSSLASAESPRMARFQSQALKFAAVEAQLNPAEQRTLDDHLDAIGAVLDRYPAPLQLLCLSNGKEAPYERYRITDLATGATIGGETTVDVCQQLLAVQNQNLLCVSNGQSGVYEEFAPYDVGRKYVIGGFTGIKTCQALVGTARLTLACISDGQISTYEKFYLYNRSLERKLGGGVSLDQCINALGGSQVR